MIELFREILRHRALVASLVTRQLAARYRGSILGFVWTFLNPLFVMLVYTLVFSIFVRDPTIEHYATYVFCGLLPWLWFSSSLLEGVNSILGGGTLITKALFPPQILPTVVTLANGVNFVLTLPLLVPFLVHAERPAGLALLALPLVVAIQLALIYAITLGVSALNVHYRDIQHILANLLSLWFFLCPILYSADTVRQRSRWLELVIVKLNPVGILTEAYHDILYWNRFPHWKPLVALALGSVLVYAVSVRIFESYRDSFAEEL